MSNFWNTSDGQTAQTQEGKFEMGGGDIAPIPDGTSVLAVAEEAKNSEYQGDTYINVKWRISKPQEYANRVIFQKVRAYDTDTQRADKAKRMLAAIAANSGGGLFSAMQQRNESVPSDMSLSQLCNRPMVLKLGVWEIFAKNPDGTEDKSRKEKDGNWVQAVAPAKAGTAATPANPVVAPPAQHQAPAQPAAVSFDSLDDDIPF